MMIPHLMPELPAAQRDGAGAERQDADRLHQCAGAQLAPLGRAEGQRHFRADVVPQPRRARLSGQPRRLSASARSGRADVPASRACARARPTRASRRAQQFQIGQAKLLQMTFADFEAQNSRRARPHARAPADFRARATSRRSPSTAGRMATAMWRIRCSTATIMTKTMRARAADGRPRGDRQFRRRRRRLCASRHRSGGARGARADRNDEQGPTRRGLSVQRR